MNCWCEEVYEYICTECEARAKYKKLSPHDKSLVNYFLKNHQNLAIRKEIDKFENKKGQDWTEFVTNDLIEANANQTQVTN